MKKTRFTHEAFEIGTDCRINSSYRKRVLLRETKKLFVGGNGRRYHKVSGYVVGKWPIVQLDMTSIKEIEV